MIRRAKVGSSVTTSDEALHDVRTVHAFDLDDEPVEVGYAATHSQFCDVVTLRAWLIALRMPVLGDALERARAAPRLAVSLRET